MSEFDKSKVTWNESAWSTFGSDFQVRYDGKYVGALEKSDDGADYVCLFEKSPGAELFQISQTLTVEDGSHQVAEYWWLIHGKGDAPED